MNDELYNEELWDSEPTLPGGITYDEAVDIQESYENTGGGGSGKGLKGRSAKSKTSANARQQARDGGQENRGEAAEKELSKFMQRFHDVENPQEKQEIVDRYLRWLKKSLVMGYPDISDADLKTDFVKSGGHGGQNVNKLNTKAQIKHKPTNTRTQNSETRSQEQNRQNAFDQLFEQLEDHLKTWKEYEPDSENISAETIIQLWEKPKKKLAPEIFE